MAMKEVEFHTGVADPVAFACRLLRKAARQGARVLVTAPPATLSELDRQLWTFEEREFLPHIRMPGASADVRARTPIWLAADVSSASTEAPRLVLNVGAAMPPDLSTLSRLIEVLSLDPDDLERGRERWRAYKAAGLNVVHHAGAAQRG